MAQTYPIARLISGNPNAGKYQATVRFGTKTVTRHIINGQGRHPDDTLPRLHNHLATVVSSLRADVRRLDQLIEAAEKSAVVKPGAGLAQLVAAGLAKLTLPQLKELHVVAVAAQLEAEARYAAELQENPLFVTYTQDGV